MKIIIVGAGIGGLSTYLFLKKCLSKASDNEHQIVIYDAYDIHKLSIDSKPIVDPTNPTEPVFTPAAIGNAIGISKNGLAVLKRIDNDGKLLDEMQKRGHPTEQWKMSTARGWDVVDVHMQAMMEKDKLYESLMIGRQAAWEILRNEVLRIDSHTIITKKVDSIVIPQDEKGPVTVNFSDGTRDEADLLIGADGLRSRVRKSMFEDSTDRESQTWMDMILGRPQRIKNYIKPHYEGLSGLGGFIPSSVLREKGQRPGTMSITFGPNGFFGCGYMTPSAESNRATIKDEEQGIPTGQAMWWGTFATESDAPFPVQDDTKRTSKKIFDEETARASLLKRYRWWKQPVIQGVLDYVEQHGVENFYPTYTTPELPTWQMQGKVVLVGDAAHALQPSSGQGACQALEDAESLALLLQHHLSRVTPNQGTASDANNSNTITESQAVSHALTQFVALRKPRLHAIYEASQKMSGMKNDMGFMTEMVMYGVLWLMTRFKVWEKYNEELLRYDIPTEVERIVSSSLSSSPRT